MPYHNRRALDTEWIDALREHGIARFGDGRSMEPPPKLEQAIEQFNGGEFWECHVTLMDVWRETPYPFRLFYHAVIKTVVGFHHLSTHNQHGARGKLRDGVELLGLFQPEWMGVRTDMLLIDATKWLSYVDVPTVDWSQLDGQEKPCIVTVDGY
jgi:predicted metal-dependent hydrolase